MFFSKSTPDKSTAQQEPCTLTSDQLLELLRPICDPDIGHSIVALGLIYRIENNVGDIGVEMTFTTPACPYGPQLMEEVRYTLTAVEGVRAVVVKVVWDPPWSLERIHEATRLEMGLDI